MGMLAARVPVSAVLVAVLAVFAVSCGQDENPGPTGPLPPGAAPVRVLMLTATAGFRHDSIPTARDVMADVASSTGTFVVTATEDLSALSASSLAAYDVVFFALTSGELALSDDQKSALLAFVSGGGGFMGAHSATDTLYNWPEYGQLIGAYFKEHPWTQTGTVSVEDGSHPISAGLASSF